MELDKKTLSLVAVGASIGANCKPCLQTNIALALDSGACEQEIEAAIAAGKRVRRCATKVIKLADSLNRAASSVTDGPVPCCGPVQNKS